MYKFLKKTLFFIIGFVVVYLLTFIVVDYLYNNKSNENAIFIWGDSQTYQGVDLEELKKLTGKNIYTAAQHGAGVYDFYVFAEKIPKNSTVIVGFSVPALMRTKNMDRNDAGFSLNLLYLMFINNYTVKEIAIILEKNILAKNIFHSYTNMFPVADTIIHKESVSRFEEFFSTSPDYLHDKQSIYFKAFDILKKKNCEIVIVEFPLHTELDSIYDNSPAKKEILKFEYKIIDSFSIKQKRITFENDKNLMYDLTHYNALGANFASKAIFEECLFKKNNEIEYLILPNK